MLHLTSGSCLVNAKNYNFIFSSLENNECSRHENYGLIIKLLFNILKERKEWYMTIQWARKKSPPDHFWMTQDIDFE